MKLITQGLILVSAYIFSVILGPLVIAYLKKLSVKQVVREEGLESHHVKTGTPTMGAFIFLIPMLILTSLFVTLKGLWTTELLVIFFSTFGFSVIGFIDDYRKVIKKHNEGLTAKEKLFGQLLVGVPIAVYITLHSTSIWIPFTDYYLELGVFKFIIALIAVIATSNAVNLTDGVDGLSTSVTILVFGFYAYLTYQLNLVEMEIFTWVAIGGLLGFLMFNKNPAKIFMGDVGSIALGGAVVALAGLTQTLLLIFIVGAIYFAETLSVTLQVLYFKKTGKRIFKMAPLHHHYELCGWSEKKIVFVFSTVTLIGVILGILSLVWRIN
ncbi:MAG: phospho-N-acetylmuramoyl-pentapeptide-transferase [Clostridia bacterium]|nr:phospho-N-acetylmuramoyl-pentapeptide-transferase [Clostridia bacterium]